MTTDRPPRSRPRRRSAVRWAFRVLVLLVAFGAGELLVRAYLWHVPPKLRADEKAGWRCVESYSLRGTIADASGEKRPYVYTTDEHGYRLSGDPASGKRKLLVLGDSFTQAAAVSDDETYYARIKAWTGAEVFACGAGGYGSLQEYMLLDEGLDRIRPDLVIWQFCTNDFINNDPGLEYASRWDNNGMRRPYLARDGSVEYELPKPLPGLRRLGESSKFIFAIFTCWDRLGARFGRTVETEIEREGASHEGFRRASATTERIMAMVKERCGGTRLVAFSADEREPYSSEFEAICGRTGIELARGVPEAVRQEARTGCVLAADRAHWNARGHLACARRLREYLERHPAPRSP